MFESAFALEAPARRSPLFISLLVQTATVSVMLLLPLYYVEQLTVMPTMPVPTYAPKLPHMKILAVIRETASAFVPMTAPRFVYRRPVKAVGSARPGPVIADGDLPSIDGAVVVPFESQLLSSSLLTVAPPVVVPKPVVRAAAPSGPVRVGGAVQAALLVHQVKPPYPVLPRQARIQGVVRLQAMIGRDGSIQGLQLVSGHPLLVQAALDAVRQWRYRPTLLNGEAVEVSTTIDVSFTLQ